MRLRRPTVTQCVRRRHRQPHYALLDDYAAPAEICAELQPPHRAVLRGELHTSWKHFPCHPEKGGRSPGNWVQPNRVRPRIRQGPRCQRIGHVNDRDRYARGGVRVRQTRLRVSMTSAERSATWLRRLGGTGPDDMRQTVCSKSRESCEATGSAVAAKYGKVDRMGSVDLLRCVAGTAVLWFHISQASKLPIVAASGALGWVGVEIFFVVSGFIIPFAMHRGGYRFPGDAKRFVARRLVRLDPPYLLASAFAALLSYVAWKTPGFRGSMRELLAARICQTLCSAQARKLLDRTSVFAEGPNRASATPVPRQSPGPTG